MPLPPISQVAPKPAPYVFTGGDEPSERFDRQIDRINSPLAAPGGGGGGNLPFKIRDVSPDGVTPEINVLYGTVMDIPPTDVGTDISLTSGATNIVYIECTLGPQGDITAAALLVTTGTLPASDEDTAILLVGSVDVDGDGLVTAINQSLYLSQGFSCCGRDPLDPVTTPGVYEFFVR